MHQTVYHLHGLYFLREAQPLIMSHPAGKGNVPYHTISPSYDRISRAESLHLLPVTLNTERVTAVNKYNVTLYRSAFAIYAEMEKVALFFIIRFDVSVKRN